MSDSKNEAKKRVGFSLDYDGCSEILFNYPRGAQESSVNKLREKFIGSLKSRAKGGNISLFNGSSRQYEEAEDESRRDNRNGHCFTNLKELAKNQNWHFESFRVSDECTSKLSNSDKEKLLDNYQTFLSHNQSYPGMEKTLFLILQLQIFASYRKDNEPADFYFIDDRDDIINLVENTFKNFPHKIPSGINLHICKFTNRDYRTKSVGELDQIGDVIQEHALIAGTGPKWQDLDFSFFSKKRILPSALSATLVAGAMLAGTYLAKYYGDHGAQLLWKNTFSTPEASTISAEACTLMFLVMVVLVLHYLYEKNKALNSGSEHSKNVPLSDFENHKHFKPAALQMKDILGKFYLESFANYIEENLESTEINSQKPSQNYIGYQFLGD